MSEGKICSNQPGDTDQAGDEHLTRIQQIAIRFRAAIGRCDPSSLSICMQDFPAGSCGDAALLLGTYLIEHGFGTFMYASGERTIDGINGRHSHAWLEGDGIIVDITADQFHEIDERVIVARHSDWHATFERDEALSHVADYRIYDVHTVSSLGRAYGAICAEMERG